MKDTEANVKLIKHINKRIEEFFYEYPPEKFESLNDIQQAFARYMRMKEAGDQPKLKTASGGTIEHMFAEDVVNEQSATIALLKLSSQGQISLLFAPYLFIDPPMPDEVREALITVLRFHADRLEDRSIDEQMLKALNHQAGAA